VRKKPINLWRLNDCVCRALTLTQINPTISTSIYIVIYSVCFDVDAEDTEPSISIGEKRWG
jgi:hypothetical protein